jgi:hypothetical protein
MLNQLASTAIAIVLIGQFPCVADEFPNEFISLLKPGMKAAVPYDVKDSQGWEFLVMTKDRFEMELDGRRLDITQMCAKYPTVAKAVDEMREKLADDRIPRGQEVVVAWDKSYTPVTIEHVGKNYVLFSVAGNEETRIAIPASRISAIRWGFSAPTIAQGFRRAAD